MTRLWALIALILAALAAPPAAAAHEVRPALLQITETAPQTWTVFWKQPAMGDVALRLTPSLSGGWLDAAPDDQYAAPGFLVKTWTIRSPRPLSGQTLKVEGLDQTIQHHQAMAANVADKRQVAQLRELALEEGADRAHMLAELFALDDFEVLQRRGAGHRMA